HGRLPGSTRRKVGMTSSHHAPYVQGFTHATMAHTEGCETVRWSESLKVGLSSDRGLQLDPVKLESLVIADQQCCGEYVPGPCTHRPSRHESWYPPKRRAYPVGGGELSKVGLAIGRKSYKGSRTGRCGWIPSFLRSPAVVVGTGHDRRCECRCVC